MKTSKTLPAAFLAIALTGSGAAVATAQNLSTPEAAPATEQSQSVKSDGRGDRNDRGEQRRHKTGGRGDDGRHHRGGRGGMQMFTGLFAEVDADGDGSVTQEEIDTFRAATVTNADSSGDGAISLDEFETIYLNFVRARMVDAFQDLDADGDGSISTTEMDSRFGGVVERMDRNGDGALSPDDRGRGRRG